MRCPNCEDFTEFSTEIELKQHMDEIHVFDFCLTCQNPLPKREHSCVGIGSDGFEHNFCAKNGFVHIPHPEICKDCLARENRALDRLALLSNQHERLKEMEHKLMSKIAQQKTILGKLSARERRIKVFCNHGMPKGFCKSCETAYRQWEKNREHMDLTPPPVRPEIPKRISRKDRAIRIEV